MRAIEPHIGQDELVKLHALQRAARSILIEYGRCAAHIETMVARGAKVEKGEFEFNLYERIAVKRSRLEKTG